MSDDGWDDDYVDDGSYDDGPYDDYAGDGGYDDGPCEDYTGDRGDCDEQDVGTTGYAEVEEVNDDNYRNAEG